MAVWVYSANLLCQRTLNSLHVIAPAALGHQPVAALAELEQVWALVSLGHAHQAAVHVRGAGFAQVSRPAHGFDLGSSGGRGEQAEGGVVLLLGVLEVVRRENGVATAARGHARRVADVLDGRLDGGAQAVAAPGMPIATDGVYAFVEVLKANDTLGCGELKGQAGSVWDKTKE